MQFYADSSLTHTAHFVFLEPWSLHCCPDVHFKSGPSEHGSGQGMFGANDQATGDGSGLPSPTRSAHCKGGGKGEGEDQEAVRDCAQQAPGLGKHHSKLSFSNFTQKFTVKGHAYVILVCQVGIS